MSEPTTTDIPFALDHNEQLAVHAELGPLIDQERELKLSIDLSSLARPTKLGGPHGHFQNALRLVAVGKDKREELSCTPRYDAGTKSLVFERSIPAEIDHFELTLYGKPIIHMQKQGATLVPNPDEVLRLHRLFVDELRLLADAEVAQSHLPVDRKLFDGLDATKHAPITELHTHSSGQLSGKDLIDLGKAHGLDYPIELLTMLGITLSPEEQQAEKKMGGRGLLFKPGEADQLLCEKHGAPCDVIPLAALSEEHRRILENKMRLPQDMTLAFSDFDRAYYRCGYWDSARWAAVGN